MSQPQCSAIIYTVDSFNSLTACCLHGQVKQAVFYRALTLSKYFSGKNGLAPLRKIGPFAYGLVIITEFCKNIRMLHTQGAVKTSTN